MSNKQRISALRGQTGTARKVFDVLHVDRPLFPAQVYGLLRNQGHAVSLPRIEGALADLARSGVVEGSHESGYSRLLVVMKQALEEVDARHMEPEPEPLPKPNPSISDRLIMLALTIRTNADKVAAQIDEIALEVESERADVLKNGELVTKLKGLLSEMGV